MTMTYAAQVRSMSKSLPKQSMPNELYDINSLRIICQYFVGSTVIVKTIDEIFEGVLHTISNNKICLTLVTVTKLDNPEKVTKVSPSKLISLNEVLCISTKDSDNLDVTVKGKHIKNIHGTDDTHCTTNNQKMISKTLHIKEKINDVQVEQIKNPEIREKVEIEEIKTEMNNLEPTELKNSEPIELKVNSIEKVVIDKKPCNVEAKKVFAFNPNAPEFKPRPMITYSDNVTEPILFSPQTQPFPQVFTPNSAPAIFVPNLYFFAPNQLNGVDPSNVEHHCMENNLGLTSNHSDDRIDYHLSNNPLPFTPIVPIFQPHPMPIFIPNSSYKIRKGHARSSESSNNTEVSVGKDAKSETTVDNELTNPSHWPPLPNPVMPITSSASAVDVIPQLKKL